MYTDTSSVTYQPKGGLQLTECVNFASINCGTTCSVFRSGPFISFHIMYKNYNVSHENICGKTNIMLLFLLVFYFSGDIPD